MSTKERRRIVAIDTNTLIWGVRKKGPAESVKRAKWLFEQLQKENALITVSAVAMSEFLIPVEPDKRQATATSITRYFNITPFDVRCVNLAASLFVDGKVLRKMGEEDARKCLKADTMIVACAKVAQAEVIYTHDAGCRTLAKKIGLRAEDLPDMGTHLFAEIEPADGEFAPLPPAGKLPAAKLDRKQKSLPAARALR